MTATIEVRHPDIARPTKQLFHTRAYQVEG